MLREPDGFEWEPHKAINTWNPYIVECLDGIDGDGTQRHWKYPGAYSDQPAVDVDVYRVIRGKWVAIQNDKIKKQTAKVGKSGKVPVGGGGAAGKRVGPFQRALSGLRRGGRRK